MRRGFKTYVRAKTPGEDVDLVSATRVAHAVRVTWTAAIAAV